MLYDVSLTRTSTASLTIRVEANSAEEAEEKALEAAGDEDFSGCVVEYDFDADGAEPVEDDDDEEDDDESDGDDEPESSAGGDLGCSFCDATQPSVQTAIEAGWIPGFFVGEGEQSDPVCADCQAKYLTVDESGEDVLKPEYAEGQYVSVWQSGERYMSYCVVNVETREVEIFQTNKKGDADQLVAEYVLVGGQNYKAASAEARSRYSPDEQARMYFRK